MEQENPTLQEIFVLYLQPIPPVSAAIRLGVGGETWAGRLHHLPSGQIITLNGFEDLLPAINRVIQAPIPPEECGGLK